jgi:hypothetical protein
MPATDFMEWQTEHSFGFDTTAKNSENCPNDYSSILRPSATGRQDVALDVYVHADVPLTETAISI